MATNISKPSREYVDVDFSFVSHPTNKNLAVKKNFNSVRQSIVHLLTLKEGDKPFHPEIKSPIYGYLFENASVAVKILLQAEVLKYINHYEPRVNLTEVVITFPDPNTINCVVKGIIISIQENFTVNVLVDRLR